MSIEWTATMSDTLASGWGDVSSTRRWWGGLCPSLAGVAVVGALFDVGGAEEGADAAVEHAARRLRDALAL